MAAALGLLGDTGWLVALAQAPALRELAAHGCTAPRSGFRDRAARPAPLDYRPLETLLDAYPSLRTAVAQALRPGSGACTIRPEEVPEALRGLASPHVPVRWHAALVLGDRGPGDAALATVRAPLRDATRDTDPTVARLAAPALTRIGA